MQNPDSKKVPKSKSCQVYRKLLYFPIKTEGYFLAAVVEFANTKIMDSQTPIYFSLLGDWCHDKNLKNLGENLGRCVVVLIVKEAINKVRYTRRK